MFAPNCSFGDVIPCATCDCVLAQWAIDTTSATLNSPTRVIRFAVTRHMICREPQP